MKKIIYYIKQLLPLTYWEKYKTPEDNIYRIVFWRQWFGKQFNVLEFDVFSKNPLDMESFKKNLIDKITNHLHDNDC